MTSINASRRAFLRQSALLSAAAGPLGGGLALNLAAIGSAAAQSGPSDYKALVCVFMGGGNDHANTVLSWDEPSWSNYVAARSVPPQPFALDRPGTLDGSGNPGSNAALEITNRNRAGLNTGRRFALNPKLDRVRTLYDVDQRAAIVANVGPLIAPMTRQDWTSGRVARPRGLFSHNDQQAVWASFAPEGVASAGWGGLMGDLMMSQNANALFTTMALGSGNIWLAGRQALQYQLSPSGAVPFNGLSMPSTTTSAALRALFAQQRPHLIERERARTINRSIEAQAIINQAMTAMPASSFTTPFPRVDQGLGWTGDRLRTIAQLIAGRGFTGARRQVFFVMMEGFDTHGGGSGSHNTLMNEFNGAVDAFYRAMVQLGVADKVTLFTASDFGRTLTSNGAGSDHGWGGHYFAIGGAVRGGDVYGRFPQIALRNETDADDGRLIPAISVDQYAAVLGRWFGVSDTDLVSILPNLGSFGSGGSAQAVVDSAVSQIRFLG